MAILSQGQVSNWTGKLPKDLGSRIKLGGMIAAFVVLILFVAFNSSDVKVDFLVATATLRLAFALILAAALGFVVGYFVPRRAR